MSLEAYHKKRSFDKTPEPKAGNPEANSLRFVVQKHDASHLHYDFRLEMDGVLKSWAVPKGPSMDPEIKRLAIMVEDHPYDYRTFEGIIPKGEYGGGTVMVWDEGTYETAENELSKAGNEKELLHQLHAGRLKFILKGKKLKGIFSLAKMHGKEENTWLLMKIEDKYATEDDILLKDKSVISKMDINQIATAKDHIYHSEKNTKSEPKGKKPVSKKVVKKAIEENPTNEPPCKDIDLTQIIKKAPESKFRTDLTPMLATLVDEPFDDPEWLYEIKWDGYRAMGFLDGEKVELKSRNQKPYNEKFYPIYNALKKWNIQAIVDGEVVVVNEKGLPDFNALQNWKSENDGELVYYVFDILWLNGRDLTSQPQTVRSAILKTLMNEDITDIRTGFSVTERGIEFFDTAREMGLEGIIAKKADAPYFPGDRSRNWLKIKTKNRQEVIIAGYTRIENTPKPFSSLVLGVYHNGVLQFAGKVGTGFNDLQQKELLKVFKPYITKKSPFPPDTDVNKPTRFKPAPLNTAVIWLKPELICEINFTEITENGTFRHPVFVAMREDKKAREVSIESKLPADEMVNSDLNEHDEKAMKTTSKKLLLDENEDDAVKKINGHELSFTNLDKLYWPDEKITKRDLINYYDQVSSFILPYLKNRPMSLNRFPNGIKGMSFYQKDVTGKVPDWIETFEYRSKEEEDQQKNYMVGSDKASLLYMANLGCIDMNPWNSRVSSEDNPDWCLLDLDPDSKNTFEQVIETALVIKSLLDSLHIPGYCKTSGSTGMHIYIPLGAKYSYDQCQMLAQWIAVQAHEQLPKFTSIERLTKKRKGKLYIDFLQNRPQATLAAPYCVRPKPGATVSMPLHWEEVKPGLRLKDFTIFNAIERLEKEGDIFKPVLGKGIDLEKVLETASVL